MDKKLQNQSEVNSQTPEIKELCEKYGVTTLEEGLARCDAVNGNSFLMACDFVEHAEKYSNLPNFGDLLVIAVTHSFDAALFVIENFYKSPFKDLPKLKLKEVFAAAKRTQIKEYKTALDEHKSLVTEEMHVENFSGIDSDDLKPMDREFISSVQADIDEYKSVNPSK